MRERSIHKIPESSRTPFDFFVYAVQDYKDTQDHAINTSGILLGCNNNLKEKVFEVFWQDKPTAEDINLFYAFVKRSFSIHNHRKGYKIKVRHMAMTAIQFMEDQLTFDKYDTETDNTGND